MEFFKKITASLLLVIYLFSATDTSELLKLPALVNHYYHHRELNKNIGFVSFLTMHYCAADDADNDAEEDKQLPFKSVEHSVTIAFISLTPPLLVPGILHKREIQINPCFGMGNDLFLPSQSMTAIWQPPRNYCCIIG